MKLKITQITITIQIGFRRMQWAIASLYPTPDYTDLLPYVQDFR